MGCVYILKNEAMPGLIKIGYTTRTAEKRADELYEGITGVPMPFEVAHEYLCEEPEKLEREIHRKLTSHRINQYREFFTEWLAEEFGEAPEALNISFTYEFNRDGTMEMQVEVKGASVSGRLTIKGTYALTGAGFVMDASSVEGSGIYEEAESVDLPGVFSGTWVRDGDTLTLHGDNTVHVLKKE